MRQNMVLIHGYLGKENKHEEQPALVFTETFFEIEEETAAYYRLVETEDNEEFLPRGSLVYKEANIDYACVGVVQYPTNEFHTLEGSIFVVSDDRDTGKQLLRNVFRTWAERNLQVCNSILDKIRSYNDV